MEDTQIHRMLLGIKLPWLSNESAGIHGAKSWSPVNNLTEQAWQHLDTCQLLIISDFFPEYEYVNKTQQAQ